MNQDVRERDVALQELARYLSACYYEPGPEFAEEKVFESIGLIAQVLGPEFGALALRLAEAFSSEDLQDLLVDYTRLFLGPVNVLAQPYEASWAEGVGMGPESIRAIEELYEAGGFGVAEDFRERPDHIAVELEYLYLLRSRENQGRRTGDEAAADKAAALRRRLLSQHLGRWAGSFAAAVEAGARSDYYRALAGLTARYVDLETAQRE